MENSKKIIKNDEDFNKAIKSNQKQLEHSKAIKTFTKHKKPIKK